MAEKCLSKELPLDKLVEYYSTCRGSYDLYNSFFEPNSNIDCIEYARSKKNILDDYNQKCNEEEPELQLTEKEKNNVYDFLQTYNADYIHKLPPAKMQHLKEKLKRASKQTLVKLIENQEQLEDNLYVLQISNIEGPYLYYYYKIKSEGDPYPKYIRLYGEHHRVKEDVEGTCSSLNNNSYSNIVDFMEYQAEHSPHFIDFFVEFPMFEKDLHNVFNFTNYLPYTHYDTENPYLLRYGSNIGSFIGSSLKERFANCIEPIFRRLDKRCKIMRIHNVDIRSVWTREKTLLSDTYYLTMLTDDIRQIYTEDIPKVKTVLKKLIRGGSFSAENLMNIFMKNRFLKKQIKKTNPFYLEKIKLYFNMVFKSNIEENVEFFTDIVKKYIDYFNGKIDEDELEDELEDLDTSLFAYSILILGAKLMDMYFLCRLFKTYKHKVESPEQPSINTVIFVYAGAAHTEIYANFFNFLSTQDDFQVELLHKYEQPDKMSCINTEWY